MLIIKNITDKMRFLKKREALLIENAINNLCISGLLIFGLFFFMPFQLFFTNTGYSYPFRLLFIYSGTISLIITLILALILTLLKEKKYYSILQLIVFSMGFATWIEGQIINWNLGLLDGRSIDWALYKQRSTIDILIWVCMFAIPIIFKKYLILYTRKIAIILILSLFVNFLYLGYKKKDNFIFNWRQYFISQENLATFSGKENVVYIVLDTFQSNLFNDIINEDDSYKEAFKDFIYYKNAVGGFRETYPSLPLILTSRYYDNSVPLREWDHKVFLSKTSLPYILRKNNFKVDLFPMVPSMLYLNPALASNVGKNGKLDDILRSQIFNVALMRSSPYLIKPLFYNSFYDTYNDKEYITALIEDAKIGYTEPAFKFFHLWGVHRPLYLDENLKKNKDVPYNDYWYKQHGKADLKLITLFLKKLKEMGLYDKTLIIISGDHGSGNRYTIQRNLEKDVDPYRIDTPDFVVSVGLPLLLIKPLNSHKDFTVSDAPVSLMDISKTILDSVGIDHDCKGKNILKVNSKEKRKRYFYFHNYFKVKNTVGNDEGYYSTFTEYEINGNAWDSKNWKKTNRFFEKNKTVKIDPEPIQLGDRISFKYDSKGVLYQKYGWSIPEKTGTWIVKKKAYLKIPVHHIEKDFLIDFSCVSPFDRQIVFVTANGHHVGYIDVSSRFKENKILIPKKYIKNNEINLELSLQRFKETDEFSKDNRKLGLHLKEISFMELSKKDYLQKLEFNSSSKTNYFRSSGWSMPEEKGSWTDGKNASLHIPIEKADRDLIFTIKIAALFKPQHVDFHINEKKTIRMLIDKAGTYSFKIEKQLIDSSPSVLDIGMDIPEADVFNKKNNDKRELGIFVEEMALKEIDAPEPIQLGDRISFRYNGKGAFYQGYGWSIPEKTGTWIVKKKASLKIPVHHIEKDFLIDFLCLSPFDRQIVFVAVNGYPLGYMDVSSRFEENKILVPKKYIKNNEINLELSLQRLKGQDESSKDNRKLGLHVDKISFMELSDKDYLQKIKFNSGSNTNYFQSLGWSMPEEKGNWTNGKNAGLHIPIKKPDRDLVFSIKIAALFKPQHVDFHINEKKNVSMLINKIGTYSFKIEKQLIDSSPSVLDIDMDIPDADFFNKKNNDQRELGIFVEEIDINESGELEK